MKSGKYFAGGLIKGTGGTAIKAFLKSDVYKVLKKPMMDKINKMYSSGPANTAKNKTFLQGLKKLDIKNQKAELIGRALSRVDDGTKKLPRKIQASLKKGARNLAKYQKKIGLTAAAYMKKKFSKQRDN